MRAAFYSCLTIKACRALTWPHGNAIFRQDGHHHHLDHHLGDEEEEEDLDDNSNEVDGRSFDETSMIEVIIMCLGRQQSHDCVYCARCVRMSCL